MIEYRLTWEMPHSIEVDRYEQLNGNSVWQRFPWDELHLTWRPHSKITRDEASVLDQHATLLSWSRTLEQPIRNVRLEKRHVPEPEEGWTDELGERLRDQTAGSIDTAWGTVDV